MIGYFGLVKGYDRVGKWIRLGEILNGDGADSLYSHAFVVVSEDDPPLTAIVEAETGGARYGTLSEYEGAYVLSSWSLTDAQRQRVATAARSLVGTPYSIMDYVSLAALRFHMRPAPLLNYVKNSGHMICSQLVDEAYTRAGLHMFKDGRFPGDVTPQDLALVLKGPLT